MFPHRFHMRVVPVIEGVAHLDPITVQMHLKGETSRDVPDDLGEVSIGVGICGESVHAILSRKTKFGIAEREVDGCVLHSIFPLCFRRLDAGGMLVSQEEVFL